jgi:sec-independent protein translocase protein TatA
VGLLDFKSSVGQKCPWWVRFPCTSANSKGNAHTRRRNQKKEKRMFGIGMPELLIILVIILVIFGAGKLPQIGEGIGKGIRNFKKATKDRDEIDVTPNKSEEISEKK